MPVEIDRMIKWIMTVISYSISKGWKFYIEDKYVEGILTLENEGFCITINDNKTYVTPMYVLDLLVRSYYTEQKEFIYISEHSFFDTNYKLSPQKVFYSPSWVRIIYFIKRIQDNTENQSIKGIDFDYLRFQNYLKELDDSIFTNIIKELKELSKDDILSLCRTNPNLTKKLECLYYVEALMIRYMEQEIEEQINMGVVEQIKENIDTEQYKITLTDFFLVLKKHNDDNVLESDLRWLKKEYFNLDETAITLLGLEEKKLPSSLEVTLALKKYTQKADYNY